jgi:hypothetical protein
MCLCGGGGGGGGGVGGGNLDVAMGPENRWWKGRGEGGGKGEGWEGVGKKLIYRCRCGYIGSV